MSPGLGGLAHSVLEHDEVLGSAIADSQDYSDAYLWVVTSDLLIDPVGVDVGERYFREIPHLPDVEVSCPLLLER